MRLSELSLYLQKEGLLAVHFENNLKRYVPGSRVFKDYSWENMRDVFGVYQGHDGRYCVFITDSERGIPEYSVVVETEEEACDALIQKIERVERIYTVRQCRNQCQKAEESSIHYPRDEEK